MLVFASTYFFSFFQSSSSGLILFTFLSSCDFLFHCCFSFNFAWILYYIMSFILFVRVCYHFLSVQPQFIFLFFILFLCPLCFLFIYFVFFSNFLHLYQYKFLLFSRFLLPFASFVFCPFSTRHSPLIPEKVLFLFIIILLA